MRVKKRGSDYKVTISLICTSCNYTNLPYFAQSKLSKAYCSASEFCQSSEVRQLYFMAIFKTFPCEPLVYNNTLLSKAATLFI